MHLSVALYQGYQYTCTLQVNFTWSLNHCISSALTCSKYKASLRNDSLLSWLENTCLAVGCWNRKKINVIFNFFHQIVIQFASNSYICMVMLKLRSKRVREKSSSYNYLLDSSTRSLKKKYVQIILLYAASIAGTWGTCFFKERHWRFFWWGADFGYFCSLVAKLQKFNNQMLEPTFI